jgi:biopolymer transport protein ExbD
MVKVVLVFLLFFVSVQAQELAESPLTTKIKSFLDEDVYEKNKEFINIIFDPKEKYFLNDRIEVVEVIKTLKENGLLKLFFDKPQKITLNFKTNGSPLFFVKLMRDSLRNIGYYRYVTVASTRSSSEFTWSINLRSEYATDPLVLETQLNKSGCKITDIVRDSSKEWTYVIDMGQGYLNVPVLHDNEELKLKRSLYAHWLNSANIESLKITSSRRNNWYPYIAYYDSSLHLLKVIKEKHKRRSITLEIPPRAKYIKISDLYTLKNVKDELVLMPIGTR